MNEVAPIGNTPAPYKGNPLQNTLIALIEHPRLHQVESDLKQKQNRQQCVGKVVFEEHTYKYIERKNMAQQSLKEGKLPNSVCNFFCQAIGLKA